MTNISKVLIANRGEIVFRICRTLKKMNIASVSIFTEADEDSPHKNCSNETVFIDSKNDSYSGYLDQEEIINAAKKTKSDAIHPGFGFLSENHSFAKKVRDSGLCFIGPSYDSIRLMGDKVTAKKTAVECGFPVLSGSDEPVTKKSEAIKIATKIGYPVIIKASAGGGGKGMKIAFSEKEIEKNWDSLISESHNIFKDTRMLVEKYVEEPRHIEVQILCDKHENIKCLGERECSIQRRHQKIIEETPSTFVDQKLREKMFRNCEDLAKKINYFSAGTIELLVDKNKNFFFLEANTRIQVEHVITEMVTGIDIVEQMIRIEEGKSIKELNFSASGHSIEARVYAEDYKNNFLPSSGQITDYIEPEENFNTRVEAGVAAGTLINSFYDPMLAKVCVKEKDRQTAIKKLISTLSQYFIGGEITTNINLLILILNNADFINGNTTTSFIEKVFKNFDFEAVPKKEQEIINVFAFYYFSKTQPSESNEYYLTYDKKIKKINTSEQSGIIALSMGEDIFVIKEIYFSQNIVKLEINNKSYIAQVRSEGYSMIVSFAGYQKEIKIYPDKGLEGSSMLSLLEIELKRQSVETQDNIIIAPLAGLVVDVFVKKNEIVKKGQPLVCVESMKMQNTILATTDCKILSIKVTVGDSIEKDELLIEVER